MEQKSRKTFLNVLSLITAIVFPRKTPLSLSGVATIYKCHFVVRLLFLAASERAERHAALTDLS